VAQHGITFYGGTFNYHHEDNSLLLEMTQMFIDTNSSSADIIWLTFVGSPVRKFSLIQSLIRSSLDIVEIVRAIP